MANLASHSLTELRTASDERVMLETFNGVPFVLYCPVGFKGTARLAKWRREMRRLGGMDVVHFTSATHLLPSRRLH